MPDWHSNKSPAVKLAKQLYNECQTVKPEWEQLVPYGATQSVWIERAEELMKLAPIVLEPQLKGI